MKTPSKPSSLPSLFLSHGAPTLAIRETLAHNFLKCLAKTFEKPKAILVFSAHWLTESPCVTATPLPQTIHDFSGFDESLSHLHYPAKGAPELAQRVAEKIGAKLDNTYGLDHGAWIPLMLLYPKADIPVLQVSLQPQEGALYHHRLGQKLSALREEGVLIIGSGSMTHNLRAIFTKDPTADEKACAFADWMEKALLNNNHDALLHYRQCAPHAVWNHPTDEHLLPLFVARGAAYGASEGEGKKAYATQLHRSFDLPALAMDAYAFAQSPATI